MSGLQYEFPVIGYHSCPGISLVYEPLASPSLHIAMVGSDHHNKTMEVSTNG